MYAQPFGRLLAKGTTYKLGDPCEEILIFHGALVGFECDMVDGEVVRIPGKCYPLENDNERRETVASMHEQAEHVEQCDCGRHYDMTAEVIEYDTEGQST